MHLLPLIRLRQQPFLFLDRPRQDLVGKQARDAFAQGTVERGEKLALGFVQLDRSEHPVSLATQRDDQRRAEFAVLGDDAGIGNVHAIGIDDFIVRDGVKRVW